LRHFGDINLCGAPGNAAATPYTSKETILIQGIAKLVAHKLFDPGGLLFAKITPTHSRKIQDLTGIPTPDALHILQRYVHLIYHVIAIAGRANHGAVRATQTFFSHLGPVDMAQVSPQYLRKVFGVESLAHLLPGYPYLPEFEHSIGDMSVFQPDPLHDLRSRLASHIYCVPISQISEKEVIALFELGTGIEGRAKTVLSYFSTVQTYNEGLFSSGIIVRILEVMVENLIQIKNGMDITGFHRHEDLFSVRDRLLSQKAISYVPGENGLLWPVKILFGRHHAIYIVGQLRGFGDAAEDHLAVLSYRAEDVMFIGKSFDQTMHIFLF
jgi:hypothetical protein